jgi:hypothetical protein
LGRYDRADYRQAESSVELTGRLRHPQRGSRCHTRFDGNSSAALSARSIMGTSEKLMMGMVTLWESSMSSCGRTLKCSTATRKVTGSHGDQRTPTLLCGCGSSSTTILRAALRKSLHQWPHLLRLLRILEGSRSQSYRPWNGGMLEPVFDRACCNDLRILLAGAWQLWRAVLVEIASIRVIAA